jgi:hypothetical protein
MTARTIVSFFLLVFLLTSLALAQGIEPYPLAYTHRLVHPKTPMLPPPVNTVFQDPDFGAYMVRVTDQNTKTKPANPFFRDPGTETNAWSADGTKFFVFADIATNLAFGFDPTTMAISALPGAEAGGGLVLPLRTDPTFSYIDPDLMYGTEVTAPLTIATYRFSTGATTPLFDTTTCGTEPPLVAGHHVNSSDISISGDDNRIEINAGGTEFGNRTFVIVYDQQLGCRWYNTQTGQIGGAWGPVGQAIVPDSFLINHAYISGNGRYVKIDAGKVGFYVWDLTSLNVTPCYIHRGPGCGGYGTLGYDTYVNTPGITDEMNAYLRPLGDLTDFTQLVNPLPKPHLWGQTKHFTWGGGHLNDSVPVCGTTYSAQGGDEIKQPYDNEIFCIETDGLRSTIWRFAHTRATWDNEYYWTEPFGSVSLDGRFLMFTSGWDEQVGTTGDGDPRTDVWIVKLD